MERRGTRTCCRSQARKHQSSYCWSLRRDFPRLGQEILLYQIWREFPFEDQLETHASAQRIHALNFWSSLPGSCQYHCLLQFTFSAIKNEIRWTQIPVMMRRPLDPSELLTGLIV